MSHARANPQLGHSLKDKLATRVADGSVDPDPDPDPPPLGQLPFFSFSDQVRNERKETQSPAAVHDLVLAFVQLDLRSLIDVLAVALYG